MPSKLHKPVRNGMFPIWLKCTQFHIYTLYYRENTYNDRKRNRFWGFVGNIHFGIPWTQKSSIYNISMASPGAKTTEPLLIKFAPNMILMYKKSFWKILKSISFYFGQNKISYNKTSTSI